VGALRILPLLLSLTACTPCTLAQPCDNDDECPLRARCERGACVTDGPGEGEGDELRIDAVNSNLSGEQSMCSFADELCDGSAAPFFSTTSEPAGDCSYAEDVVNRLRRQIAAGAGTRACRYRSTTQFDVAANAFRVGLDLVGLQLDTDTPVVALVVLDDRVRGVPLGAAFVRSGGTPMMKCGLFNAARTGFVSASEVVIAPERAASLQLRLLPDGAVTVIRDRSALRNCAARSSAA
jgi:hypothetical protein